MGAVAVRNPLLAPIAETITTLGGVFGIGALMMALLAWVGIRRHNWRLAGLLAGSMGLSVALTLGLKDLITRVGPPASATIGPGATGFAFPSGYTLNTTVFFGLLAGVALARTRTVFGRIGIVAGWLVASLLVGLSRLYLGYQWLTDVMAGFGVGVGVLAITVIVGIGFGGRELLGRRVG